MVLSLFFSVKYIDTGASYQGDDDHAACKRQKQRANKVSISAAPVVDLYKPLASYLFVKGNSLDFLFS